MANIEIKRGLVLEGGGAKGAYEFGCLLAFRDRGISFDCVSGTSVGALNAALWATDRLDYGLGIWSNLAQDNIYPFRRPRLFYKTVAAPVFIVLHTVKLWFLGALLPAKVNHALSHLLASPLIIAVIGYALGFAVESYLSRKEFDRIAMFSILLLFLIWTRTVKSLKDDRAFRLRILAENAFYAILFVGVATIFGNSVGTIKTMIFLVPFAVGISLWSVALFAAKTNFNFLDSSPLQKIIAEVMTAEMRIPTFVTCAVAQPIYDPNRPTDVRLTKDYVWHDRPIKFVPRYHRLNILDLANRNAALLASAALPLGIVRAVEVCGEECVDGGIIDNTPILPLLSLQECDEIFIVRLTPTDDENVEQMYVDECKALASLISKSQQQASFGPNPIIRHRLDPLILPVDSVAHFPRCRFVTISPSEPLGGFLNGTMNFSAQYAQKLVGQGYADAIDRIEEMRIVS